MDELKKHDLMKQHELEAFRTKTLLEAIKNGQAVVAAVCARLPPDDLRALAAALQTTHAVRIVTELPAGKISVWLDGPNGSDEMFSAVAIAQTAS